MKFSLITRQAADTDGKITPAIVGAKNRRAIPADRCLQQVFIGIIVIQPAKIRNEVLSHDRC